ncbi:MAG: lysozyme inhibitor LprI family protein [Sphingomonadaceae bacterium]
MPVQCTNADSQAPVIEIIKDEIERSISSDLRNNSETPKVSKSKIRAVIAKLVISIEDIRTVKEDPNSTKRFCAGTLKIRFPGQLISDADKARETAEAETVADLADRKDIDREADTFVSAIDFNVQKTDDGSKIFAEAGTGNRLVGFTSEVIAASLLRPSIENAQQEQQLLEQQQTAQQNAALQEQRQANLEAARVENKLAVQRIGALWQSLPAPTRTRLLPLQRAWIRKKDADCRVEAASASVDPMEMATARLTCDTRITQQRSDQMEQFVSSQSSQSEPDGTNGMDE